MAHKKQPFRFRFSSWLSGPTAAARPATEPPPRHPKNRPKSPTKPDINVPIQRPWSPPIPTKTQGVPRAEPKKWSPSHPTQPTSSVIIESSETSQSEPPRSTTPNSVTSSSSSLQSSSHAGSPSRVSIASSSPKTQPQSPSHLDLDGAIMFSKQPAEESTQPATSASKQEKEKMVMSEPIPQEAEPTQHQSPSHLASDGAVVVPKPAAEESSQPASSVSEQEKEMVVSEPIPQEAEPTQHQPPSHLASDGAVVVPKPAAEESSQPASSVSEQEKEMVVSEPMPEGVEPKINSPLKAIIKSPDTFSQPENLFKQTSPSLHEAPLETQSKSPETSFQPEMISTQPSGSEPPQASSVPPPSPGSKTQPAASQPQSSSPLASKHTSKVLKPNADESTFLASSATQEEIEKMAVAVSEPVLQETEPKMKSPLKIIPKSPETSSQQNNLSIHSKAVLGDEERSKVVKAPLETQSKLLQSEENGKVVPHLPIKAEKAKHTTSGKPVTRTVAYSSGTQANDSFIRVFRADKKQLGVRETVQRKVMFATSHPSKKDIRVVSSANPGTRNVSGISPERPVSSNEEKAPLQKGIKDDISKFVHKLATVHPTQPMDDKQFSIITLAGDNRGATIHVCSESANKEGPIHIHCAYKTDPEESIEVSPDGEENSDTKKDSHSSTKHDEVGKAYFNSNIQSINNLLMFHGSVTERDPGVQVPLPQNPAEPIKSDDKLPLETHKTEFNINRAEKSNYQPMV